MDLLTQHSSERLIRASYGLETITVYQAYSPEIADPAVTAGRFVPPFKADRMTWIKPSFLWMMYRSGFATKPGQERILAVSLSRAGFEWALRHSSLTQFDLAIYSSRATWEHAMQNAPVRIQWDPGRDLHLQALPQRAIQVGVGPSAVTRYINEWVMGISDITGLANDIQGRIVAGDEEGAAALLPPERIYQLSDELSRMIGATY